MCTGKHLFQVLPFSLEYETPLSTRVFSIWNALALIPTKKAEEGEGREGGKKKGNTKSL
jgi:hypothetical protein